MVKAIKTVVDGFITAIVLAFLGGYAAASRRINRKAAEDPA